MTPYAKQVLAATVASSKVRPLAVGLEQALFECAKEIEWLIAERDAALADAERYRWLRDESVPPHNFCLGVPEEFAEVRYTPAEVDAAIDAAREAP